MPNIEVIYWSMRVMAFAGVLMFLVAALGAWLYWRKKLERARWFQWTAIVAIALPYIAATAGWILTEMGRQPWIVQDLLKTADANSPAVSTTWLGDQPRVFVSPLRRCCSCVDIWLMRRYADRDPPAPRRGDRAARPRAGAIDVLTWTLADLWFFLVAFLWSGYFLLEGFDFGVGMLLPFLPRERARARRMFRSIGPVWDGNEVWLVDRRRRDVRRLSRLVRDDVLGLLPRAAARALLPDHPRRSRSSGASKSHERALARRLDVGQRGRQLRRLAVWGVGALEPPLRRADQLERRLRRATSGISSTPTPCSAGSRSCSSSPSTARRISRSARPAISASARPRPPRRLSLAAAVVGAGFLVWTVAVAVDRNDKDVFPPAPPRRARHRGARARGRCSCCGRPQRLGVRAHRGRARCSWVATLFTSLYPRVMVSSTDFGEQPHRRRTPPRRTTRLR